MILKILTDEIVAAAILVSVLILFFLGPGSDKILTGVLAFLFTAFYFLGFLMLKVFAPSMYAQEGRYEDCIGYAEKSLAKPYSVVRKLGGARLHNYFKLYSAYSHLRLGNQEKAKDILAGIEDNQVFPNQFLKLKVLNALVLSAQGEFKKALDSLTALTVSKLPKKIMPDMFYIVSLCYLELDIEYERAMTYAQVAYGIRSFDPDFKTNYAVALCKCKKEVAKALELLKEVYENFEDIPKFTKQRLLFYLYKITSSLNMDESKSYIERLKTDFSDSLYLRFV